MSAYIEIDVAGAMPGLEALLDRLGGPLPLLQAAAEDARAHVDMNFSAGQNPYGQPWEPLSPVTIANRRRGSSVPLRDTGRLANSIEVVASLDSILVGTNVEYAGTHQWGAQQGQYGRTRRNGPIPWGDVPARKFLPDEGLPPELEAEVNDTVRSFLDEAMRSAV
ncbi:MAG: phage virion morphogenesis protein [Algiphilus sp.]|uniref:phage virion morphogenesis protein n=1 Tax=Algiphilus sp. TaxID=1872431 RepID=UPI0032EDC055